MFLKVKIGGLAISKLITKVDQLNVNEVRLISEKGEQIGILSVDMALKKALEVGLDLVLVGEKSNPPVCKLTDYGKLVYEKKQKSKNQKKSVSVQKLKEIRLHLNTDEHDFICKMNQAKGFLLKGDRVKINIILRGREIAKKDVAFECIEKVVKYLEGCSKIEKKPTIAGRSVFMMLLPSK